MHEGAMAQSLLSAIVEEAKKRNAAPVTATISCGVFSAVNDELLIFAFEAIAKDTVCSRTKLKIEHKPIKAACRDCKKTFEFDIYNPHCPACGGEQFDLSSDPPLMLESIEFSSEQFDD